MRIAKVDIDSFAVVEDGLDSAGDGLFLTGKLGSLGEGYGLRVVGAIGTESEKEEKAAAADEEE